MRVTIHQPEHLPWLGLIDKIAKADRFVVLDTVQFEKNYFQNRNRIRSNSGKGFSWLTVPLKKHRLHTRIKSIEISYNHDWIEGYLNILRENYRRAPHFERYFSRVAAIVGREYVSLAEANVALLEMLLTEFGVSRNFVKASELGVVPEQPGGSEVIIEICGKVGADKYLAGVSGKNYLQMDRFTEEGIEVAFHSFTHPEYVQQYQPFMSHMSAIDLLMNEGREGARAVLFGKNRGTDNDE